jgi:hypothetical protein
VVVAFTPLVSFAFTSIILGAAATAAVIGLFAAELRKRRKRGAKPALEIGFEPFRLNGSVLETQSVAQIGARPRREPTDFRLVAVPLRLVNNGNVPARDVRVVASIVSDDRPNEVRTAYEAGQEPAPGVLEGTRVDRRVEFEFEGLAELPSGKVLALNCATWIPPGPASFYVEYVAAGKQADSVNGKLLVNVMA